MKTARKLTDRRIARTQRSLHEALLSLILERGWDAIGVQDICERADVGRSTFYVHFADKEELLLSGFAQLEQQLRAHVSAAPDATLAFVGPLIAHVAEYQRLYRALVGKRSAVAVQKRMLHLVSELLEDQLSPALKPGPRRAALVRYAAGGFLELLIAWLEGRGGLSARELEASLVQLTGAVFAQTRRSSGERP